MDVNGIVFVELPAFNHVFVCFVTLMTAQFVKVTAQSRVEQQHLFSGTVLCYSG